MYSNTSRRDKESSYSVDENWTIFSPICRPEISVALTSLTSHEFGGAFIDGLLIGWMGLSTTCIHHSELNFTDHRHTNTIDLSLSQPTLTVLSQRLVPREIPHLHTLRPSYHSRLCRTLVNWQLDGPQCQPGLYRERKFSALKGIELPFPGYPAGYIDTVLAASLRVI
jgi:hypothetical protein